MGGEALVLVGEEQVEEARIDAVAGGGKAPAAVGRGVGAEQLAVAIDDEGGEGEVLAERCGAEGNNPPSQSADTRDQQGDEAQT